MVAGVGRSLLGGVAARRSSLWEGACVHHALHLVALSALLQSMARLDELNLFVQQRAEVCIELVELGDDRRERLDVHVGASVEQHGDLAVLGAGVDARCQVAAATTEVGHQGQQRGMREGLLEQQASAQAAVQRAVLGDVTEPVAGAAPRQRRDVGCFHMHLRSEQGALQVQSLDGGRQVSERHEARQHVEDDARCLMTLRVVAVGHPGDGVLQSVLVEQGGDGWQKLGRVEVVGCRAGKLEQLREAVTLQAAQHRCSAPGLVADGAAPSEQRAGCERSSEVDLGREADVHAALSRLGVDRCDVARREARKPGDEVMTKSDDVALQGECCGQLCEVGRVGCDASDVDDHAVAGGRPTQRGRHRALLVRIDVRSVGGLGGDAELVCSDEACVELGHACGGGRRASRGGRR